MHNRTNTAAIMRRCEAEIARVEREGGPIRQHRASYLAARGVVDNVKRQQRAGLGFAFVPLLGWALAALVGVATVVGSIAIAQSTSAIATQGQELLSSLTIIAGVGAAIWAAAKLAPGVAGSYRATRRALA
jgi:hypothetical protein